MASGSAEPIRLAGAIELPDGSWVRGRGVREPLPPGPVPDFGVYLGVAYAPPWSHQRVAWRDFGLPRDPAELVRQLRLVHQRALAGGRVEVGCGHGLGRTGTAIAALAVLAGLPAEHAVVWTREHYRGRAVETRGQRRFVERLPDLLHC